MSTIINISGKGLVIATEVSKKPALRPSNVFKLPGYQAENAAYISATLVALSGVATTRKGIQIQNVGVLPTASSWELRWYSYQGTPPTTPSYNHVPLTLVSDYFAYLIDNPLPSAIYVINLRGYEANQSFLDFQPITVMTAASSPTPVKPSTLTMTTSSTRPA